MGTPPDTQTRQPVALVDTYGSHVNLVGFWGAAQLPGRPPITIFVQRQ